MRFVVNDSSCGAPIRRWDLRKSARISSAVLILAIALSLGFYIFEGSPAVAATTTAVSAKKEGIDYTCICCATKKSHKKGKAHQGR